MIHSKKIIILAVLVGCLVGCNGKSSQTQDHVKLVESHLVDDELSAKGEALQANNELSTVGNEAQVNGKLRTEGDKAQTNCELSAVGDELQANGVLSTEVDELQVSDESSRAKDVVVVGNQLNRDTGEVPEAGSLTSKEPLKAVEIHKSQTLAKKQPEQKVKDKQESTSNQTNIQKKQSVTNPQNTVKPSETNQLENQVANASTKDDKAQHTVKLSISCSTILNNKEQFNSEKLELLPESGMILDTSEMTYEEGETVFDVLVRATKDNKIHMEYTGSSTYNTNYIEGIHNIYEFDCGPLSGWMYKVNGVFPNYGCSNYKLKDGDVIEWVYTCDLGKDVGGDKMFREGE